MNSFIIDVENIKPVTKGPGPIVIVDDDESQIVLVKACYKKSKRENELICLNGGEEFLTFAEKIQNKEIAMPELVLLDINMPKKNGFDVLKELRRSDTFRDVPIIVMFTTSDSMKDVEMARELRANGFFSKPSHISDYIKFFKSI